MRSGRLFRYTQSSRSQVAMVLTKCLEETEFAALVQQYFFIECHGIFEVIGVYLCEERPPDGVKSLVIAERC